MTRGATILYEGQIKPFAKKYQKQIDAVHAKVQEFMEADKEKKNWIHLKIFIN